MAVFFGQTNLFLSKIGLICWKDGLVAACLEESSRKTEEDALRL